MDAYVLPRASLALLAGGLLAAAGLLYGERSLGPLRLPALAVALAAVGAAVFSVSPAATLIGVYGRYESLPMRLAYLGLFYGAARLGERKRTVDAYLVGCAIAALEALYEAQTHSLPRPDGNLGQPNLLGALLAMAIPLAVDRAIRRGGAGRAWFLLAGVCGAGLLVSDSRSGWLGALAGLCALAVWMAPRRRLGAAAAAGGLVAAVAVLGLLLSPLRTLNQDTGSARLGVWRDALAVVAQRPLLGAGEDTMGLVFGRHQTADWEPGHNFDRAHSLPLDLAAAQGLLGLAACAWFFLVWWRGIWRHRELAGAAGFAGAAAAYLAWSLFNFDWAPATAALWLLAGAAWPGEPVAQPVRPRHPGRLALATLAIGLGLLAAVPPVAADLTFYAGHAATAIRLDPLQAHYHAALGTRAGLRQAAALGDPNPGTYVALGDAEEAAGDREAALAAYRQALAIYPYDADARARVAALGV